MARNASRAWWPLLVFVVLTGCANQPPVSPVSADLLEGASQARPLTAANLAEETPDESLAAVLDEAGFTGAAERTWTDRGGDIWRTVVRVLRFRSPGGATSYLDWADAHVDALLGPSTAVDGPDGLLLFEREPSACCPNKGEAQALALTAADDTVLSVTLSGPGADARAAAALLARVGH
jgi:hypothetical protein